LDEGFVEKGEWKDDLFVLEDLFDLRLGRPSTSLAGSVEEADMSP
jgi:hypothetical protein